MPLHFVALASETVLLWKEANKIQTVKEALLVFVLSEQQRNVYSASSSAINFLHHLRQIFLLTYHCFDCFAQAIM